ncbi:MAG: peptide chain release factor-like protein [Deltaproteobacteria bacterium]|nr:peptide chain release factor-like protein [Deltaproteobacteria bacterium]
MFPVSFAKQQALLQAMANLKIREEDLVEEFTKGSGPGGQKINKSSVTVLLTHAPSGLQVRCQQTRSQALNRYYARKSLIDKLAEKILGEKSAKQQAFEKIRRQKRKRSKRAKEKMLAAKKHQGAKKQLRKMPEFE